MASFAQTFGVPVGEKTKTWLPVGSDPLSEVRLPLWVAAGKEEGPMVAVTGGVHGAEYAGILGAIRVFGQLDPSELKGTVVVIPVCNPVAFSFLRHIGVLADQDPAKVSEYEEVVEQVTPRVNHGGIFLPAVVTGDRVEEGGALGEIRNIDDEVLEAVHSPFAGIVRMLFTVGVVNTGDPLMHIWQTRPA